MVKTSLIAFAVYAHIVTIVPSLYATIMFIKNRFSIYVWLGVLSTLLVPLGVDIYLIWSWDDSDSPEEVT